MRFLFIYHAGQVPESDQEENIRLLWDWLDNLKTAGIEKSRFVGEGVQEISQQSAKEYSGNTFGISIIECASLDEAIDLTNDWPELPYGGTIELLKSLA